MHRRGFLLGSAASALLAEPAAARNWKKLGGASLGPSLDLNLLTGTLDQRIAFGRTSKRTIFDNTGTMQELANNVPGFDYDQVSLAARGLLIEEQRTNGIRNPRAEGAVVGTPGTLPTNWAITPPTGISSQIVGFGSSAGIPYVDIRVFGTTASQFGSIALEASGIITASNGQTWTSSVYMALVGGSLSNIGLLGIKVSDSTNSNAIISSNLAVSAALSRWPLTGTLAEATPNWVQPFIYFNGAHASGDAIDFTLRIGAPQLELGAFATSVILPPAGTPAAALRAGEGASLLLPPWYNPAVGTLFIEWMWNGVVPSSFPRVVQFDDNVSNNNAVSILVNTATGAIPCSGSNGGVSQWSIVPAPVYAAGSVFKGAISWGTDTADAAINGVAGTHDNSVSVPSVSKLRFGVDQGGSILQSILIRRFRYWPRTRPIVELQQVTT